MRNRANLSCSFGWLLISVVVAAQTGDLTYPNTVHPCPGGVGTAEISAPAVPSLATMVRSSELIVVGTVAKILPSYNPDPAHPVSIETESLVTVTGVLYESRPLGTSTIDLAQTGGKVGKCTEVVPADPLVSVGEEYVLFLRADRRKNVPNTSGAPRYYAVGVWSGKVKVVDGKVKLLPSASAGLHKYDGVEKRAFLDTVTDRIDVLFRGKQPS